MHIRPARRDEVGEIAALWAELVAHHQTIDPRLPVAAPDGDERYAYALYEHIDHPRRRILVAVNTQGELMGYVFGLITTLVPPVFIAEQTGLVADMYVRPAYRRQGVGRALYETICVWFRAAGVSTVEWDVAAKNEAAQAFWQSVGGDDIMVRMRTNLRSNDNDS